jgi:CBS domain-containing protein
MTPHVVSGLPDESVSVAARLMLQKKISGLPVVNDLENIVGVVSESDFLRRTEIGTKTPAVEVGRILYGSWQASGRVRPVCRSQNW